MSRSYRKPVAKQVHPFLTVIQNVGTKGEERK